MVLNTINTREHTLQPTGTVGEFGFGGDPTETDDRFPVGLITYTLLPLFYGLNELQAVDPTQLPDDKPLLPQPLKSIEASTPAVAEHPTSHYEPEFDDGRYAGSLGLGGEMLKTLQDALKKK